MAERNAYTGILAVIGRKAEEKKPVYFRIGTIKNGEDSGNISVSIGGIEYSKTAGDVMKAAAVRGAVCVPPAKPAYTTHSAVNVR